MSSAPIPASALAAYRSIDATAAPAGGSGGAFGTMLGDLVSQAIASGREADAQSAQAISGQGDLTHVVTAVSRAQLALQTTVAVRDRVLQAYQDIIKMPI